MQQPSKQTILSRLSRAFNAGTTAFRQDALVPNNLDTWDSLEARLIRYDYGTRYYNNTIFTDTTPYIAVLRARLGLYKFVRGIYNPVSREVDLMVANIYGGNLDTEKGTDGAIPLMSDDPAVIAAIIQVWQWSDWQRYKNVFTRYGATLGDTVIKIVDDRRRGRVMLQPINPAYLTEVEIDDTGLVVRAVIEYDYTEIINYQTHRKKTYRYKEVITPDEFVTYRDGKEYAYFQDSLGVAVSKWPNPYGFVPIVLANHKNVGGIFGATPYHTAIPKINELNDQSSLLNDQLRRSVRPVWLFTGVKASKIEFDLSRDDLPAVYAGEGATATAMTGNVDATSVLTNIQNILEEIERDLPELAIGRLRAMGTPPSGVALNIIYSDASNRIIEARANYDAALIVAHNMALAIGGLNRLDGFTGYNPAMFLAGMYTHRIKERPVFPDTLSKQERINVLAGMDGTEELILRELEYPQDEIDIYLAALEGQRAAAVSSFANSVFGSGNNGESDTTTPVNAGEGTNSPSQVRDPES